MIDGQRISLTLIIQRKCGIRIGICSGIGCQIIYHLIIGVVLTQLQLKRTIIFQSYVLGLSADYVLFGEERKNDAMRADNIRRIDDKYLPLLDRVIAELLSLSELGG